MSNSNSMNEAGYLKGRLEDQIDWYDKSSIKNQAFYKKLQVIIIVASAVIPFLSGLMTADQEETWLKVIVGLLGITVTIATALMSLGKYQENWIKYRTTCESLRHEKYLFSTGAAPYDRSDAFKLLVERVESLLSQENSEWQNTMKQPINNSNNGNTDNPPA